MVHLTKTTKKITQLIQIKTAKFSKLKILMDKLIVNGKEVKITSEPSLDLSLIKTFEPFQNWIKNLDENLVLNSIHFQSMDMFGKRLGFLKFKSDIIRKDTGKRVPGIVFMRGGAVAILIVIDCGDKKYTIVTKQSRVPIGAYNFIEIPAGMLDNDNNFAGVAAKEMKEETGIEINEKELINLTKLAYGDTYPGIYPSVGACDEFISLFLYKTKMNEDDILKLENKLGGVDEHEIIHLGVYKLDDLWKITSDVKTLSALLLYEKLLKEGKI